jgi:hypothetical protein
MELPPNNEQFGVMAQSPDWPFTIHSHPPPGLDSVKPGKTKNE